MKRTVISENQRGFLFKDGKYVGLLGAGKHRTPRGGEILLSELSQPIVCSLCPIETLLADAEIARQTVSVEVGDEELALHFVNGRFVSLLRQGRHLFWSTVDRHEFRLLDISTPEVDPSVPAYIFSRIAQAHFIRIEVGEHQKGQLYFDRRFVRLLDAGTHFFWKTPVQVEAELVDTRLRQMDLTGQELLTADKVTLRISFVCNYRITDCVRVMSEVEDYGEQLHVAAQLALREYVGKHKLDEILESKAQMSEFVFRRLCEKGKALFVEVSDAGVKDIILPGEIREIMNTVLVAEKRAQANVITRREEVASTRSLLNTARLMEENQTLYKLKELEYIERICENVGSISLSAGGGILSQLAGVLHGDRA